MSQLDNEVARFCQLLGKDLETSCFRSIQPCGQGGGSNRTGWDSSWAAYQVQKGYPIYMVINNGGQNAKSITSCPALFCEWDDISEEEQINKWKELGIPRPTFQVVTGGKSVHTYWVLRHPIKPEEWARAILRLIKTVNSDKVIKDLPRVMRVPGMAYISSKTGKISERVSCILEAEERPTYDLDTLTECFKEEAAEEKRLISEHSIDLVKLLPSKQQKTFRRCITPQGRNVAAFKLGSSLWAFQEFLKAGSFPIHALDGTRQAVPTFKSSAYELFIDFCQRCGTTEGDGWGKDEWNTTWNSITKEQRKLPSYVDSNEVVLKALRMMTGQGITPEERSGHLEEVKDFLIDEIGEIYKWDPANERSWWRWNGKFWEFIPGNDYINHEVYAICEKNEWGCSRSSEIAELVKSIRFRVECFNDEQDILDKGYLPFGNCCLDLKTGGIVPHSPKNGNTWALQWKYHKGKSCPKITEFLQDRMPDSEDQNLFRSFCWAALTGKRPKAFLEIVSNRSSTGKSVLGNLLQAALGNRNCRSGTLKLLEDSTQRFETFKYKDKRLARFDESANYTGPLDILKKMTGGDLIGAERKGSNVLNDYYFTGVVMLIGNGPVACHDSSDAISRRRRTIFVDKPVPYEQQKILLEQRHGEWFGELVSEIPYFVNWILDTPKDLGIDPRKILENSGTASQKKAANKVAEEVNPVLQWAEECLYFSRLKASSNMGLAVSDAYQLYADWAKANNRSKLGNRRFGAEIRRVVRDHLMIKEYENPNYGRKEQFRLLPGVSAVDDPSGFSFYELIHGEDLPPFDPEI